MAGFIANRRSRNDVVVNNLRVCRKVACFSELGKIFLISKILVLGQKHSWAARQKGRMEYCLMRMPFPAKSMKICFNFDHTFYLIF